MSPLCWVVPPKHAVTWLAIGKAASPGQWGKEAKADERLWPPCPDGGVKSVAGLSHVRFSVSRALVANSPGTTPKGQKYSTHAFDSQRPILSNHVAPVYLCCCIARPHASPPARPPSSIQHHDPPSPITHGHRHGL
ncbi:hypothetical protein IF2G_08206 [Cordyceps javanica]|nr:hypothetical protein IF2G_08206 [Cordyceps javanica]